MIISWEEYSGALKEISKKQIEIGNLKKQMKDNEKQIKHIVELCYEKLQCNKKFSYKKELHTNQILKKILFHVSKIR